MFTQDDPAGMKHDGGGRFWYQPGLDSVPIVPKATVPRSRSGLTPCRDNVAPGFDCMLGRRALAICVCVMEFSEGTALLSVLLLELVRCNRSKGYSGVLNIF